MKEYPDAYVEQMRKAFRSVQDKENWKYPVDAVVPGDSDKKLISDALIFFAGSPATFINLPDGTIRVLAAGYYACIGS